MDILEGVDPRPTEVNGALRTLATVADRMHRRGDARAAFPEIYGVITRYVAGHIAEDRGFFHEPAFISRLAGRFCERYIDTLTWSLGTSRQDCGAWSVAYDQITRRATSPFQDVCLGLQAHINFDLAQGIHQTIVELGAQHDADRLRRFEHDHDVVNHILEAAMAECFERLVERYGCRTSMILSSRPARAVVFAMTLRLLQRWRADVWRDVLALCRADEATRRTIVARMDRRSRRIGQAMVAPNAFAGLWRPLVPIPARRAAARLWRRPITSNRPIALAI